MQQFARTVIGYHGCSREFAASLLTGELAIADWKPSRNSYDWLGHGIYFWEHAPDRAREWAEHKHGESGASVIGALIQLGTCLDFTDVIATGLLRISFDRLCKSYEIAGMQMPENEGGPDNIKRMRDCEVINFLVEQVPHTSPIQTVRGVFIEGSPVFPGSGFHEKSHIQLAVRDTACILGVFRPSFLDGE